MYLGIYCIELTGFRFSNIPKVKCQHDKLEKYAWGKILYVHVILPFYIIYNVLLKVFLTQFLYKKVLVLFTKLTNLGSN